jgi:hypothetical protein
MSDLDQNIIGPRERRTRIRRSSLIVQRTPILPDHLQQEIIKEREQGLQLLQQEFGSDVVNERMLINNNNNDINEDGITLTIENNENCNTSGDMISSPGFEEPEDPSSDTVTVGRMFSKSASGETLVEYPLYTTSKQTSESVNQVKLSIIVTDQFQSEPVDCLIVSNTEDLDCVSERDAFFCKYLSPDNNPNKVKYECKKFLFENNVLSELDRKMKRIPKMRPGGVFVGPIPGRDQYMAHVHTSDTVLRANSILRRCPETLRTCSDALYKKLSATIKIALEAIDCFKCTSCAFCPVRSYNNIGQYAVDSQDWVFAVRTIFYSIYDYCSENVSIIN